MAKPQPQRDDRPIVEQHREFVERHHTTPDGQPYSFEGREWLYDELWRPFYGWKLWPVDAQRLCEDCSDRANTIVDGHRDGDSTRTDEHSNEHDCAGLNAEKILIVALNLNRQDGKTFGVSGLTMAASFKSSHESIALMGAAEDQMGRIFTKNYRRSVEKNPKLEKRCRIVANRLLNDARKNDFEVLPTTLSAVGDTRTIVLIDEAREVPPDVAVALMPTLFARGGWECPRGHMKTHTGVESEHDEACSVCGAELQPWYGRAVITSSHGELHEDERDWFAEFVEKYTQTPHPNVHVFASSTSLNPKVATKVVDVVHDVFGSMESTAAYADIEAGGKWRKKGDEFLSPAAIKRATGFDLQNDDEVNEAPCVAFLDTSLTIDKTSFVIVADDLERSRSPWEFVYQTRVDYWDPSEHGGVIPDREVIANVEAALRLYPNLVSFYVDTRGSPWGSRAVKQWRKARKTWSKKVHAWQYRDKESQAGWDELEERILSQPEPRIRLMQIPEQLREFKGLKRGGKGTGYRRDKTGRVEDKNRGKSHKDITESTACCCYLINEQTLKRTQPRSLREATERTGARQRLLERLHAKQVKGLTADSF